jgi:serine/threonine-protein kinase
MSSRRKTPDDDTPLGATEMQALRRLAEPLAPAQLGMQVESEQLWASRYRVKEKIGKGGMGDVYLAHDVVLDRHVALKVLRKTSDESFVDAARLLREARAAARVEHHRLARIYDALTWNDQALIAMEYVRGETLRDWLKTYRPTSNEIVAILQQLLEGLQVLHESGLVHRDLKPENVMVTPDGNLRILDLGIARRVALDTAQSSNEAPGTFTLGFGVGTPGYMAPEQWRHGEIDARADLFALGVIAYELVAGRQPFCGSTNLEIREQTLNAALSFVGAEWKDIPAAIKSTVETALERDPGQRFQNVSEMAKRLVPLFRPTLPPISGSPSHPIRPPGEDHAHRESLAASVVATSVRAAVSRPPALIGMAGLIFLAGLSWFLFQRRARPAVAAPATRGMVQFAGGKYSLGTDRAELDAMCASYPRGCPPEAENETPSRQVTVAPFELDEREVTNEEFAGFLKKIGPSLRVTTDDEDPSRRFVYYGLHSNDDLLLYDRWGPGRGIEVGDVKTEFSARSGYENLPVTLVTWLGARLYCKSALKRLPTEAEWEFAARGSGRRLFPWGNEPADCNSVHISSNGRLEVRNPERCDNARTMAYPVMSAPQDVTPERVFDMGGNVSEWVDDDDRIDRDEATYVSRLTAEGAAVHRGGSYNAAFMARSTSRNFQLAFNVGTNLGFRCAKSMPSNH